VSSMRFFITGSAGFIGFHLAERLLDEGHEVVGLDGFTAYYDVSLKEARTARLTARNGFTLHRVMLEDRPALEQAWSAHEIDVVVHLAGQAGVRYSLENPRAYIDANIVGTFNLMELIRQRPVQHFMLASTSSAYGANTKMPFHEADPVAHPMTLYAATKIATEVMTHSYSHLWGIPTTAFRFFTVYGPWGRPDMAPLKFTELILKGQPIDIYNHGQMARDFTYIDDLIEGIYRLSASVPTKPGAAAAIAGDTLSPVAPHRIVNIGGGTPVALLDMIAAIETATGKTAIRNLLPMQPGDVAHTFADATLLEALTGYRSATPIDVGIEKLVAWYRAGSAL
jgi:UDP-glucuronate 4-epimerase